MNPSLPVEVADVLPEGPERVPLVTPARAGTLSPTLTRIVAGGDPQQGPARVSVAAFQSAV